MMRLVVKHTFLEVVDDVSLAAQLLMNHRARSAPPQFRSVQTKSRLQLPSVRLHEICDEKLATHFDDDLLYKGTASDNATATPPSFEGSDVGDWSNSGSSEKADWNSGSSDQAGKSTESDTIDSRSSADEKEEDSDTTPKTTWMLRDLPKCYTRSMLIELLNREGFSGLYDFLYLPVFFGSGMNFGYAFINFVTVEDAENFRAHFQGLSRWSLPGKRLNLAVPGAVPRADVTCSGIHQGLAAHVERYRNSPMMHPSVPDEYRPVVFRNGARVAFPQPTKALRVPRTRRRQ